MSPSVLLAASLLVGALTYLTLAAYVWRVRRAAGARALSLLLLAAGVWTLCYAHEIGAPNLAQARRWADLKYVGYCFLAPCLWAFVLRYTGTGAGRTRAVVSVLLLEPLAVLTLLALPSTTRLIHSYPRDVVLPEYVGGIPQPHPGVLYGPHMIYTFVVLGAAVVLLITRLSGLSGPFRRPSRVMIAAASLPLLASVASHAGVFPREWPDPAAYLFLVTAVVLVWGFFRLRLVDLLPGAWRLVVARMPDAVLVVDDAGRVLDTNPAADRLLGPGARVGTDVARAVPHLAPVLAADVGDGTALQDVVVPALRVDWDLRGRAPTDFGAEPGVAGVLEAQVTPVAATAAGAARIVVLRDVTERRASERQLRELLDEQLAVSRILGRSLRPVGALPAVPGLELAARSLCAQGAGASWGRLDDAGTGEFVDVHRTGDGGWAICLGEVEGHDVQAAALTALARASVRTLSAQATPTAQLMSGLNRALFEGARRSCSIVYARTVGRPAGTGPPAATRLEVAVSGPVPLLVRHGDGSVEPVGGPGEVLGVDRDVEVPVCDVVLDPGEVLLACTVGVTGSLFHSERFGIERLALALRRAGTGAEAAADGVLAAVRSFATQTDDLALVAMAGAGREAHP